MVLKVQVSLIFLFLFFESWLFIIYIYFSITQEIQMGKDYKRTKRQTNSSESTSKSHGLEEVFITTEDVLSGQATLGPRKIK